MFARQICVVRGDPYELPVCTTYHSVLDGETCSSIMAGQSPPLTPLQFFAMNPGLMCDNLMPTPVGDGMGGQAVSCLAPSVSGNDRNRATVSSMRMQTDCRVNLCEECRIS